MSVLRHCPILDRVDQIEVFDHFVWMITAHQWTSTLTDSGTATVGDAAGGIVALVCSDGTVGDNDEAYLKTSAELFKVAAGKKLYGAAYIQFTEANTDDANVFVGFQNAIGANSIVDDGAGLKVSGDTFAIYKVDGGTVWKCVSAVNGTSTVSTSAITAGGASYQLLEVIVEDDTSTHGRAVFKVDGRFLRDSTTGVVIQHRFAYASATEMNFGFGAKNGGTNLETLNCDWAYAAQKTIAG